MSEFVGATSYWDCRGKLRWRYRRGRLTLQLPGNPAESSENLAAYIAAVERKEPPQKNPLGYSAASLVRRDQIACSYFTAWVIHARNRGKKKGLSFRLTGEYLAALAMRQSLKCAVSGLDLEFKTAFQRGYRRHPFAASVDRINNDRGYEPGNVRIVCLIVNLARSDFGDDALLKMAAAITAAHP